MALTGCATPSNPGPVAEPKPLAVDPRICAPAEAEPKIEGGMVQPATDAEREAADLFLNTVAAALEWGRLGWARATMAKDAACN